MELSECTNRQNRFKGNCKQCGKDVYSYYKSQLPNFCSRKCSNQWKWDNIRERKKYVIFKCSWCGKDIKIEASDHRIKKGQVAWFCNHDCESKYKINKREMQVCPICGKLFFNKKSQTCSMGCRSELMRFNTYKRKNKLNDISYNEYLKLLSQDEENKNKKRENSIKVVTSNGAIRYYNVDKFVYKGNEKEYLKKYAKAHTKQTYQKHKERMKNDDVYRLKHKIRNFIYSSFVRRSAPKNDRTESILGCSFMDFKKHIEKQFKEGMTFDNYGEWQIDHIIPLSTANTIDEVKKLCHYTNLQPLWASENRKKSDKIYN